VQYQQKHRLTITCNIITQIPLIQQFNEKIKGEEVGREKKLSVLEPGIITQAIC
jgi:hypothetical protein